MILGVLIQNSVKIRLKKYYLLRSKNYQNFTNLKRFQSHGRRHCYVRDLQCTKSIKQILCANTNTCAFWRIPKALLERVGALLQLTTLFSFSSLHLKNNHMISFIGWMCVCVCEKRKPISGTFRITIWNLIRLSSAIAINTFIAFILLGSGNSHFSSILFFIPFSIPFFFVFSFDGCLHTLCGESFVSLIWLVSNVCNICWQLFFKYRKPPTFNQFQRHSHR